MTIDWSLDVVDVSQHQGVCDFSIIGNALAPHTLCGAIVKVTEGARYIDPYAHDNITAMAVADLRYQMIYHFMSNDEPQRQVDNIAWVIDTYQTLASSHWCLWIDVENNSATDTPLDLTIAREVLHGCYDRWPDRVGWYAPRSIASECRRLDSIFHLCELWLACPDGNIDAQADTYNATLVQWGETTLPGTSLSSTVLRDVINNVAALDAMCNLTNQPTQKGQSMILIKNGDNVSLWDGSKSVYLGGLPSVYSTMLAAGVPLIDATTPEGAEFAKRLNIPTGSAPSDPRQGVLHLPAVDAPITFA